jgi:cytidylate kinase
VLPGVRRLLVERQRELGSGADIVMEGRDIGTNVFPEAEVKVYLTARPQVRAARRAAELRAQGEDVDEAAVLAALLERDRRDSEREVAPLRRAEDAVEVDTSELTLDEVVDLIVAVVGEKVPS